MTAPSKSPGDSPAKDEDGQLRIVRRLLLLAWSYRKQCAQVLLLQLAVVGLTLSGLSLTGLGIDVIQSYVSPGSTAPRWPGGISPPANWSPVAVVALIAAGILVAALLQAAIHYAYTVSVARLVQEHIVVDLRASVFAKLQSLSFRFFDRNASSAIINRVTADVQMIRMFVDGVLLPLVVLIISAGIYIGYMAGIHVALTVACVSTIPVLVVVAVAFARIVKPAYFKNRRLVDEMVSRFAESLQGIQVVKGFGREEEEIARFRNANDHVQQQQELIFERVSRFQPTVGFLTQSSLIVLLLFGGWLTMRGELPLGSGLVVFAGLLKQLSTQAASIAGITNTMQRSLTSARRVFEILDEPIEIQSKPGARKLERVGGRVTFENVTAEYEPGATVLHDVSFEVSIGQRVALLGATGSGKSALLGLIPRFYDPACGRVLLDGCDARDLNLDQLRRSIGIVFQESFLFSATIAANIAFGRPGAGIEEVTRAARIASADDFIRALPDGYATVLGIGGMNLSGGQRQRIAIARAVLLDPPILILDDPTAAIDPGTEAEILDALESAMRGRTTFIVAHRLSTLRRADRIFVLEQGRIVQSGTHAELLAQGGLYQRAVESQLDPRPSGASIAEIVEEP